MGLSPGMVYRAANYDEVLDVVYDEVLDVVAPDEDELAALID